MTEDKYKYTGLRVDRAVWKEFKKKAIDENNTITEELNTALRRHIDSDEAETNDHSKGGVDDR